MTKVVYQELMARADALEVPIVDQHGQGIPTEDPQPPCGLEMLRDAAEDFATYAGEMRDHLKLFDKTRKELARQLRNAAKAYRHVDEDAAEAVLSGTPLSGVAIPASAGGDFGPTMLGAGAEEPLPEDVVRKLHSLEEIALQLEQPDQGASFERFAEQWSKYRDALRHACDRFRPFQEWEGDAATAVGENFDMQRAWLNTMARFSDQMARQAKTVVKEFRSLRDEHVYAVDARYARRTKWDYRKLVELEQWVKQSAHTAYQTFMVTYNEATRESQALLTDFRLNSTLPVKPVNPTAPPRITTDIKPPQPWKPATRPTDKDIQKAHILKPATRPDWMDDEPKPTPTPTPTPVPAPSNENAGMPTGMTSPTMPTMPSTPQTHDAQLAKALSDLKGKGAPGLPHAGGGVKPASVGGAGVPAAPLQPSGDGEATARPSAAGPGNPGRGVPGLGAMGGGMGGGMPGGMGQGAGKDAGKGKRVQGAEEDALYTEDRAWTEGVIGRRRLKDGPDNKR
jgi:hypothetical protein